MVINNDQYFLNRKLYIVIVRMIVVASMIVVVILLVAAVAFMGWRQYEKDKKQKNGSHGSHESLHGHHGGYGHHGRHRGYGRRGRYGRRFGWGLNWWGSRPLVYETPYIRDYLNLRPCRGDPTGGRELCVGGENSWEVEDRCRAPGAYGDAEYVWRRGPEGQACYSFNP